jgi:hypothetical protein
MTKTPNVALNVIPFDQDPWDADANENTSIIDGILGQYFAIAQFKGLWKNSTTYVVGDNVIDSVSGAQYVCNVGNTSAASPILFSADRVTNPSYWTQTAASAASYATAAAASAASAANAVASTSFIRGMGLVYNSTTVLSITAGACADSTNVGTISFGNYTKSIAGAWVAGTGNNGMGLGLTATLNTWYHVFAILNTGVNDVYFDTSPTAANKPVGTTVFRRLGSFKLNAAVQITPFDQYGDRFNWRTPVLEYSAAPGVTTAVTLVLAGMPPGVVTEALFTGTVGDGTTPNTILYLSALVQTDIAPSGVAALTAISGTVAAPTQAYFARVMTDASASFRRRVNSTTLFVNLLTNGWIDQRGR